MTFLTMVQAARLSLVSRTFAAASRLSVGLRDSLCLVHENNSKDDMRYGKLPLTTTSLSSYSCLHQCFLM